MTTQLHNDTTIGKIKKKFSFVMSSCRRVVNKKGFTIAEMILVTIVIGILMGIGGRTYYIERDRIEYNSYLTKILGIINTARTSAIASRGVPASGKYVVPPSGYGVYININPQNNNPNFTLFASLGDEDSDPSTLNKKFDKGVATAPDTIPDLILEKFRLPPKMYFQFFKFNTGTGLQEKWNESPPKLTATEAIIFFRPPLADMYIGGWVTDPEEYQELEELSMRFYNPSEVETSPKRCQYATINRIKTYPVIEYDNCVTSSTYPLLF